MGVATDDGMKPGDGRRQRGCIILYCPITIATDTGVAREVGCVGDNDVNSCATLKDRANPQLVMIVAGHCYGATT